MEIRPSVYTCIALHFWKLYSNFRMLTWRRRQYAADTVWFINVPTKHKGNILKTCIAYTVGENIGPYSNKRMHSSTVKETQTQQSLHAMEITVLDNFPKQLREIFSHLGDITPLTFFFTFHTQD